MVSNVNLHPYTEEQDAPEGSGLKVTLMRHQLRALAWALKREGVPVGMRNRLL